MLARLVRATTILLLSLLALSGFTFTPSFANSDDGMRVAERKQDEQPIKPSTKLYSGEPIHFQDLTPREQRDVQRVIDEFKLHAPDGVDPAGCTTGDGFIFCHGFGYFCFLFIDGLDSELMCGELPSSSDEKDD